MDKIIKKLREFNSKRDYDSWTRMHSPKNLIMALSVEVAELTEKMQWLTQEESYDLSVLDHVGVSHEIAD
jgi:NTP pyrophosphatase (non-canonical NTP hydrolase)